MYIQIFFKHYTICGKIMFNYSFLLNVSKKFAPFS